MMTPREKLHYAIALTRRLQSELYDNPSSAVNAIEVDTMNAIDDIRSEIDSFKYPQVTSSLAGMRGLLSLTTSYTLRSRSYLSWD